MVPVTDDALQVTMDQLICASLLPHLLLILVWSGHVESIGAAYSCMYVCMYGYHLSQRMDQGCQFCSQSAEQGKTIFPCPRSRLRIWSRETGSAVPSRVILCLFSTPKLNLVLTHGIPPAFRGGVIVHLFIPPTAIGSVPSLYQVTQMRTDGDHCRESAGTVPVVLKVL